MEKTFLEYMREKATAVKDGFTDFFSPITDSLNSKNIGGDIKNIFLKSACIVMATLTITAASAGMVANNKLATTGTYSTVGKMPVSTRPTFSYGTTTRKITPTLSGNSTTISTSTSTSKKGTITTYYSPLPGTTASSTTISSAQPTTTTTTTTTAPIKENTPFDIWSYNILTETMGYKTDKANRWNSRKKLLVEQIQTASPDIVCFQEVTANMNSYLSKAMPEYDVSFQTKSTSPTASHLAIYYKSDRYDLIDSGKFWLSDTPLKESNSFGTDKRICAWVKLHDKVDDNDFYVYNIHYTYKSQDKEARKKSSELINKATAGLDAPVILLGDFNANTSEPAYQLLDGPFANSLNIADTIVDSGASYNGFNPNKYSKSKPIDHIWLSTNTQGTPEFTVSSYAVEDDYSEDFMAEYGTHEKPVRPVALSDHWAISARVTLDSEVAEYTADSGTIDGTTNSTIPFSTASSLPKTTAPTDPLESFKKKTYTTENEQTK